VTERLPPENAASYVLNDLHLIALDGARYERDGARLGELGHMKTSEVGDVLERTYAPPPSQL
jgi:hypothetical protein